jgi:RsiW-degrading membrane proteinase PrsW (M82 family)
VLIVTESRDKHIVIGVHRPSLREKIFFFASGLVTSVPLTLFVDQYASSFFSSLPDVYALLFSAVFFAPFIEEFAKAFPLFYRHGETQRSIFTLGLLVGLGFGVFEFFLYVLVLKAPVIDRLPGIFFHAATTSITAYGIATRRSAVFYLIAVTLHFSNNLIAFFFALPDFTGFYSPLSWSIYAVTISTYVLCWYLYTKTSEKIVS